MAYSNRLVVNVTALSLRAGRSQQLFSLRVQHCDVQLPPSALPKCFCLWHLQGLCILCDTGNVTAADVCFLNKCQGFKYSLPQQLEMWHYFVNEHRAGSAGRFDGSLLFGYLRSTKCKLSVMVSWGPFPQSGGVTHGLCVPPEWIVAARLGGKGLSRTWGQARLLCAWSPQRTDGSLFCSNVSPNPLALWQGESHLSCYDSNVLAVRLAFFFFLS